MKIRTFSIVAGSMACNARCPGCIAGMTPRNGLTAREPSVNWRNFRKACRLAQLGGCTTAMLTSNGETTLFPDQITRYLEAMAPFDFPIIEMQTNGSLIAEGKRVKEDHLERWYELGLTTVAVSVASYDPEKNREIYFPHKASYFDLPELISDLHAFGFTVRLSAVMCAGYLDSAAELEKMLAFARSNKVEQLTCTPLTKPEKSVETSIFDWTRAHQLTGEQVAEINEWVEQHGALVQQMGHGARVYDVDGQNLCLSNCITVDPGASELRSIIFFPDGRVRYAWQYSGAVLF